MSIKSRYEIRVEIDLKTAYLSAANSNDRDGAQLIRDFMREYVKKHTQKDIFSSNKKQKEEI